MKSRSIVTIVLCAIALLIFSTLFFDSVESITYDIENGIPRSFDLDVFLIILVPIILGLCLLFPIPIIIFGYKNSKITLIFAISIAVLLSITTTMLMVKSIEYFIEDAQPLPPGTMNCFPRSLIGIFFYVPTSIFQIAAIVLSVITAIDSFRYPTK